MVNPPVVPFAAPDGRRLVYRELGEGRPLLLLHGVSGDATMWLHTGFAQALAEHGHRVVMPDLRGHGDSAKPHDAAAYPPDVLTDDALALVAHLELDDYDLGGYSLGARIAVRMLVRGAAPGRAVVAGQGMREVLGVGGGAGAFLRRVFAGAGTFAEGTPEARAEEAFRARGVDPAALLHVLDSIVPTPASLVAELRVPTLVAVGADDQRVASARELAAVLPAAILVEVPGDHGGAAAAPELARAVIDFLADPAPVD